LNKVASEHKPDHENEAKSSDSMTNVHFSENEVPCYVSGVREPIAIRIDTGVYKRFKPIAKWVYGSTCKAVETSMISIIEAVEKGVHFSNTRKPIQIDKIVIERNLRPRRDLRIVDGSGIVESEVRKCQVCGKEAYAKAIDREGSRFLCRTDFQKVRAALIGWKVI
jgi:hypothetical protein